MKTLLCMVLVAGTVSAAAIDDQIAALDRINGRLERMPAPPEPFIKPAQPTSRTLPRSYAEALAQAKAERLPLVVWVGKEAL